MRGLRAAAATLGLTCALAAGAAEIRVSNGWARPPAGDAATARAYLDIDSDVAVTLAGASSPRAATIAIVVVASTDLDAARRDAKEIAIPAKRQTRFAPRGSFLELRGLRGPVANGERVPLVLVFVDAEGRRQQVETAVEIRGVGFAQAAPATAAGGVSAADAHPPER
jgi:copper(I)-binding protein